ncbi:MAG: UbiA family prenyltransferase [Actinobacteria bacterium]|nr:UbiA family prenyltransferase [Actinomycetota bacterium]MBU4301987.1 UbiA family prenyltransferase [Actinomycetota bacterium]MBU4386428.1 UbiA family prenyltransferase [Actinomycetota bacterium]MBU4489157.1 UbiA family prenyltransferase [Actinomycetota bacterium]MCG2795268.1 UbiA family prenyltransferase [Actinomycetes bacterium]
MTGLRSGVRKYWTLLRFKISLVYLFGLTFGFSIAADANPDIAWYRILFAVIAFFCASFFASTLNFYADVEADRGFDGRFKDMDLTGQPFVTGEMGSLETVLAFSLSAAGCVLFSLLAGYRFALFMIGFGVVIGLLYSHPWFRLKARPLTDILCNITGMTFTLLAGLSLSVDCLPPVLFLAWWALFVTVVYIPTVVNDVPFDSQAGYRTSGVAFGAARLLYSMVPLTVAMAPLAVLIAIADTAWQYRLMAGLGTVLAVAGVTVVLYCWKPPHIELDPNWVLVPMNLFIIFFLVYGIIRVARGA